jgi:hypothetical protein
MTNEDKLYEVDTFVAMCEDFMHGKDGDDATKCRRLLAEVIKELSKLHQPTISGAVCDYPWHDSEINTVGGCMKCGEDRSK